MLLILSLPPLPWIRSCFINKVMIKIKLLIFNELTKAAHKEITVWPWPTFHASERMIMLELRGRCVWVCGWVELRAKSVSDPQQFCRSAHPPWMCELSMIIGLGWGWGRHQLYWDFVPQIGDVSYSICRQTPFSQALLQAPTCMERVVRWWDTEINEGK